MYTLYMVEEPISLSFFAFRARSNIGTDKSVAKSGATLRGMHSCYLPFITTHLNVEHHTEKQLLPFLKSLVWLGLGWINLRPP